VDDAKLSQYLTAGTVRKSRREKEQEAAEAKKREEEANAAKAYAEFLDTFDTDHTARKSGSNFVKADSKSAYVPASKNTSEGSSRLTGRKTRVRTHFYGAFSPSQFCGLPSPLLQVHQDQKGNGPWMLFSKK
jgi:U2-associated protein SR140